MYTIIKEKISDKSDLYVQDINGLIFHICEGTGDNLLQEDIEEGYCDYIYYSIFKSIQDLIEDNECDGGMVLLKHMYDDLKLSEILAMVEDEATTKFVYEKEEPAK